MTFTPLPPYFIVKINIEEQTNRKEKIGSLYTHFNEVQMQRNMQHGEVVAIGSLASKQFPDVQIGNTLLFHHFVESHDNNKSNFIYSDDEFNYYYVTASVFNGHRNETYAVWDGENIIPHPDFIFIEPEVKEKEISADKFIEENTKQVGSLILFTDWNETREEKENKATVLTNEIKQASKGKSMAHDAKIGLEQKQWEAEKITASLNHQKYIPYKISKYNTSFQKSYKDDLNNKEFVYALNLASQTEIEFQDKKHIVIQTKYCVSVA